MKKLLLMCMAVCIVLSIIPNITPLTYAADKGKAPCQDKMNGLCNDIWKKLYRGLANIVTCWGEIPKGVRDIASEDNVLSGCTFGLLKGAGMTVVRCAAGAYEVVTFPLPLPQGYGPILEPEFIFNKSKK
jgi:putative exosortase-associated protein (TIGR04073 family)